MVLGGKTDSDVTLVGDDLRVLKAHKIVLLNSLKNRKTMNSLKNDVKTIMENQKHVIAEILGMKTRIEALERLDFNKNVTIDIVVADLVNQKRLIHDKLVQVDRSINYLNYKLQESEKIEDKKVDDDKHVVKMCKFDRTGFCRERDNCTYFHGLRVCEEFLATGVCQKQKCFQRHPKRCIYFERGECQWGIRCKYLHQANEHEDSDENLESITTVEKDKNNEVVVDEDEEESIESIMAKAKGFDDSDDEYENENETIETIMAKARAFEDTDESEILK